MKQDESQHQSDARVDIQSFPTCFVRLGIDTVTITTPGLEVFLSGLKIFIQCTEGIRVPDLDQFGDSEQVDSVLQFLSPQSNRTEGVRL